MPTPARRAIASSDTSGPASANSSPAAASSFARLRCASARLGSLFAGLSYVNGGYLRFVLA